MRQIVEASVEIEAPVEIVYGYWQTFENLSRFMMKVDSLLMEDQELSHWVLDGSHGTTVEFSVLTIRDQENRFVDRKLAEAPTGPFGQVHFEEVEPDLTRVEVRVDYTAPCWDEVGEAATRVPEDPQLMLDRELEDLTETLHERVALEEIQDLPSTVTARSKLAAVIAGGVGFTLLTGLVLTCCAAVERLASATRAKTSIGFLASANSQGYLRSHVDSSGR